MTNGGTPDGIRASTGAAAHVQSRAERPESAQRARGRVKLAVWSAERRPVELRRQQIVAAYAGVGVATWSGGVAATYFVGLSQVSTG